MDTSDEAAEVVEGGDLGIVGDELQDFGDASFSPAPGVDTICVFPKNAARCKYNFLHDSEFFMLNSVIFV